MNLGYIRDHSHHVDEDRRIRLFAPVVSSAPQSYDLSSYLDRVRNQLGTSSCVGHGLIEGIGIRSRIVGYTGEFPAPIPVYTAARSRDLHVPDELADEGCRPRAAMDACADPDLSCLVPESEYPLDESRINERLPLELFSSSAGRSVRWHRIDGVGASRCAQIRASIAAGMPVSFGATVYQSFADYTGSLYVPAGAALGGHMQCIVAYTAASFVVLNSWGEDWGDRGFSYWSDAVMSGDDVVDVYSIESGMAA